MSMCLSFVSHCRQWKYVNSSISVWICFQFFTLFGRISVLTVKEKYQYIHVLLLCPPLYQKLRFICTKDFIVYSLFYLAYHGNPGNIISLMSHRRLYYSLSTWLEKVWLSFSSMTINIFDELKTRHGGNQMHTRPQLYMYW